jgi:aromatic ring-opening dioxygenase catalytic subunit (LigB family)
MMPTVYLPHGGGPLPLMQDPSHRELAQFLQGLSLRLPKPLRILVVSAHWEGPEVLISSHPQPGMLFDYAGFPPETYRYSYPAPGDSAFAERLSRRLRAQGIACGLDPQRGFDHASFVPLMLAYPEADIPVIQLSLLQNLQPAAHIALGRALAFLRAEGVLILGSGLSFHNMRAFAAPSAQNLQQSQAFDQWLRSSLLAPQPAQVENALVHWQDAPFARFCHPREEHLLPLHVCWGAAAGEKAQVIYQGQLMGVAVSGFAWGVY